MVAVRSRHDLCVLDHPLSLVAAGSHHSRVGMVAGIVHSGGIPVVAPRGECSCPDEMPSMIELAVRVKIAAGEAGTLGGESVGGGSGGVGDAGVTIHKGYFSSEGGLKGLAVAASALVLILITTIIVPVFVVGKHALELGLDGVLIRGVTAGHVGHSLRGCTVFTLLLS